MIEIWRDVVGYEGLYKVSSLGRLRGSPRQGTDGCILKLSPSKPCGYVRTVLYRGGKGAPKKVHRLVLEAFAGPCPDGMDACHNNGQRDDNRPENLRWGSRKENCADAKRHGTFAVGERNGHAKLTRSNVEIIRQMRAEGRTYQSIADRFGVSLQTARSAAKGWTWA